MNYLGTPADFTIIVMLVVIGVAVWFMWDRIAQLQRDVDALKRKLGVSDTPPGDGS
jgi:hypothetical protein